MEISPQRYAQQLEYLIALQRSIEYHCAGHFIPLEIAAECPHHSAMLNNRLEAMISERESCTPDENYCNCKFAEFVVITPGEICRFCDKPRR
jgi:hypothetical protein